MGRHLCSLFLTCAAVFALCFGSVQALGTDVAVTYQINAQHVGYVSTPALLPPLRVRWSVDLGATVSYPLIAEGKVFVIAGDYSAGEVNLYALDEVTGATVWGPVPIPEGAYWWAAAAYDNGKIFVVPDTTPGFGPGVMYAFSANDGRMIWSTTLPYQYFFTSPPTAFGGIVYTGGAGSGGTVYAVRETDGTLLWTANVENGDNSSPVVTSSGVYVSYVGPQTYKFSPRTGALLWHFSGPGEGGGGATPVLYNGLLYVRDWSRDYGHNGVILNATTGALTGFFDSDFAAAFFNNTAFYVQSGSLKAVKTTTGAPVWTATPPNGDSYATPPIVADGIVYVGTSSGYLLGYKSGTGKISVSMNLGYPIYACETCDVSGPQAGLGAGQSILIVPASTHVVALSQ